MGKDMETFDARLASFDLVLHTGKRTSGTKAAKPISWPRNGPSPAEMAHAGFYYNPYETNPDNTTCFLCERSLDGWDTDDNPVEEHLRHSSGCGWAIMVDIQQHSSNPAEIEDPTSENIVQARQATFVSWPHDGKRGWVCKSEKMVDGGWYFCPTGDSDDQASCPYCKLSLDGWEPKDNPFDEHYRRSAHCSFFVFAKAPGKKGKGRPKKTRGSQASRQSTQSVTTTASEGPSIDLDDPMDQSTLSTQSQSTSKTRKTKKPSKAKNPRAKRGDSVDVADQMDVDSTDYALPEPPQPKRATRGKKRSSYSADLDEQDTEAVDQEQPPPKRRSTNSRSSAAQQTRNEYSHTSLENSQAQDEIVPQKPKRGRPSKKDVAARARKASENATNSKTVSKARVPRDSELDAVLKAGLEEDVPATYEQISKPKISNSAAETTGGAHDAADDMAGDADTEQLTTQSWAEDNMDLDLPETQTSSPSRQVDNGPASERQAPLASMEIKSKYEEPKMEPDNGPTEKGQEKKVAGTRGRKPKKTAKTQPEPPVHDDEGSEKEARHGFKEQEQPEVDIDMREQQEAQEQDPVRSSRRRSSMAPPKTTQRYSDIPHEQQFAKSLTESREFNADSPEQHTSPPAREASDAVSPLPTAHEKPSSLSPQSSDAENQPPSTRGSSRNQVFSPSNKQIPQAPQAAKTPSPAKQNANTESLKTSRPWAPVDIEEILFGASSDKENVNQDGPWGGANGELTSPEKRMTIEQWIFWNARMGEDKLKRECERLVSHFEREGGRAMRALEGIQCID